MLKCSIMKETLFNNYSSMASEAKHETTKGTGLEILPSKQMLQRLPIAFAEN